MSPKARYHGHALDYALLTPFRNHNYKTKNSSIFFLLFYLVLGLALIWYFYAFFSMKIFTLKYRLSLKDGSYVSYT